ncbi:MAG TPA: RNA polymerase sigma factor [Vicinamibacterales bacterium]
MSASDGDIVRDIRRGDRDAFGQLVRKYQSRLFGLMLMMVRQPAAAEEVTQDAFVRAYTHIDHYNASRPFYPWLATIAVRLAQNWLRRHERLIRREGTSLDSAPEPGAAAAGLSALIATEGSGRLWRAVAALSSGERTAVMLYYRDEMTVQEIARALGVTSGTVKTLLFRARRHLRERLEKTTVSAAERST